jgi:predicted ABC-type ATPase
MPELYIITGSNGAGKSSVGPNHLPLIIRQSHPVFDGDKLFMEKRRELWQQGIRANKESKNLAWEYVAEQFDLLVEQALNTNSNFVYEGHFTNEATWDIPRKFKAKGYQIHLLFFGVSNPEISDLRVLERSQTGGHYVDPVTVRDNYYGNLEKLNEHFGMFDSVKVVDTSSTEHITIVIAANGIILSALPRSILPQWFVQFLPNMAEQIK